MAAPDALPLTRNFERVDRGSATTVTLVCAPAGYGKSTLVSAWLEGRRERRAWLTLDETENDLSTFVRYLVGAVRTAFPDACQATLALLEAPRAPTSHALTLNLSNELEALERPLILVLDDYQRIESDDVHDLLGSLLMRPPRPVRWVLISRTDPPLPLSRLRAKGELTEVRSADLRLSRAESGEALALQTGIRLSDASLDRLDAEIEGWAVGLRLLGLALRSADDPDDFIARLRGGLPAMRDYLIPEVLNAQSSPLRKWLLQCSILDRFCAPLCDAVCEPGVRASGAALAGRAFLERLWQQGLFAIPLDPRRDWYRFHHVFQDLLQQELERTESSDHIASLHLRASAWYRQEGLIEEAVNHALKSGDSRLAARLVSEQRHALMNQETWQRLRSLIGLLPSVVVDSDVTLLIARAWVEHYFFKLDDARATLNVAQARCDALAPRERDGVQAEIDALCAVDSYVAGDSTRTLELGERALQSLPAEAHCMQGLAVAVAGWAYQTLGQSQRAIGFLSDAVAENRLHAPAFHTRALTGLALVRFKDGDFEAVLPQARSLLRFGETYSLPESMLFGRAFLGWSHYHRNELDEAEPFLSKIVADREGARRSWYANAVFALALLHHARGRPKPAKKLVEDLIAYALDLEQPRMAADAHAFRAEIALREGRLAAAREWACTFDRKRGLHFPYFYLPDTTFAKVRLLEGTKATLARAEEVLRSLHGHLVDFNDRRRQADVLALLSVCLDAQGREADALATLNEALGLTEAGGAIRPFVDLGTPMASLLGRLQGTCTNEAHLETIMRAFDLSPGLDVRDLRAALTNRELDVLALLQRRLRDKEIAVELSVAPGTVKAHLRGLYKKLGVHTRREAVSVALRAGILSSN